MSADLLRTLLTRPIAFHPALARAAGSAAAGLFLSQLLYWSNRGRNEDGWIWKHAREWEEETCLTLDEQKTARKKLREAGLVEESNLRALGINKFSTTNAFRINFEALQNALNGLQTRVVIG